MERLSGEPMKSKPSAIAERLENTKHLVKHAMRLNFRTRKLDRDTQLGKLKPEDIIQIKNGVIDICVSPCTDISEAT
jgi:hypothetical protein